jgi:uncharacterized integral membrane protein
VLRRLAWLVSLPVILVIISFAASNREPIALQLWPLPFSLDVPLYLAVLSAFAVGFVVGGSALWFSVLGRLWRGRRAQRKADKLHSELEKERTLAATNKVAPRLGGPAEQASLPPAL